MKKKILCMLGVLSVSVLLTACGKESLENEIAYRTIGLNCMEEGDYEEALENFSLALDESVGKVRNLEVDIALNMAECYLKLNDKDNALSRIEAILALDDDNYKALFMRGTILLSSGKLEEALSDYKKAVKVSDKDYELYVTIADNLRASGHEEEAEEYLDKALKLSGKTRKDLMNRGYIYYLKGDYDSAIENLTKAAGIEKAEGEDDKTELYLAEIYDELGDTKNATLYYESYGMDHENDSKVCEELGYISIEKGNYSDALLYFEKGLMNDEPANYKALVQGKIMCLEYLGHFETAANLMAEYLIDYPSDEKAVRENLFLQSRKQPEPEVEEIVGEIEFEEVTE